MKQHRVGTEGDPHRTHSVASALIFYIRSVGGRLSLDRDRLEFGNLAVGSQCRQHALVRETKPLYVPCVERRDSALLAGSPPPC